MRARTPRASAAPKAAQTMLRTLLLVFACGLLCRELGLADSGVASSCMLAQQDGSPQGVPLRPVSDQHIRSVEFSDLWALSSPDLLPLRSSSRS